MHITVICKSTVIVNREELPSLDVLVEGRKFRCWWSHQEWNFTIPGFIQRDPSIAAAVIDGGCIPDYEVWEQIKDAIRPLFQNQALVEDQLLLHNTQTSDPFSRC